MADTPGRSAEALSRSLGDEFEVLRSLGSGSVASVFLAREEPLSRLVAIKVLHPELASDDTVRRRFEREARAAASLSGDRNVVNVHRFGRLDDGAPYLCMEFVKGRTLRERLEAEGRLEIDEALRAMESVARALALAHSKGIVHRDVRPGNVLWSDDESRALLTDFGIAAILETGARHVTRLTMASELVGNPRYLSPEQLQDQDLTEAADIYGFGVMAYELLTGEGPYEAKTPTDLIKAHLTEEPRDAQALRPEIPAYVAQLLFRCLATKPTHRPSAADVVRVLEGRGSVSGRAGHGPDGELSADLQTLLRKRVPQVVLVTGGASIVIAGLAEGALEQRSYVALLTVLATAVAMSTVVAWFHGEEGRQRAPALEYVLLAAIGAAGVALAGWIYLSG